MDWQSIQPFFSWLSENPAWSGFIVFLIALSESLLIVGLIVPGTVLMFGVGTLIGTGVLDIKETMFVAFIGAIMGDAISFWIGARYHDQLSKVWPLKNNPDYLDRGKQFFKKHGGKSILFGRFVGPIRPIIPAVAGMMGMSTRYFLLINVVSAAAWAPFYLLPGIVFGTSIGLASIVGTRLIILLLILFVSVLLLVWVIRKLIIFISPRIDQFYLKCYRVAAAHSFFGGAVKAIIDPDTAERKGLYFFSILIISFLMLASLFFSQFTPALFNIVNEVASNMILAVRNSPADKLMLIFWEFFSWLGLIVAAISFVVSLYFLRQFTAIKHLLLLLALVILTAAAFDLVSKSILPSASFIDFRILLFSTFLMFVVVIVGQGQTFVKRWMYYSIFSVVLLLLCFISLYFAKANISQILSSLLTSGIWIVLFATVHRRHAKPIERVTPTMLVLSVVFIVWGGLWAAVNFQKDYETVELKTEQQMISYQKWQTEISVQLPVQREDMFGTKKQNFNIQFQGNIDEFQQDLMKLGWQEPLALNYQTILFWLKPEVKLNELPRIPQTHLGEKEIMTLVKYVDNNESAIVLQLWPSAFKIKEYDTHVYIGSVTRQKIASASKWLSYLTVESVSSERLIDFENKLQSLEYFVKKLNDEKTLLISRGFKSEE